MRSIKLKKRLPKKRILDLVFRELWPFGKNIYYERWWVQHADYDYTISDQLRQLIAPCLGLKPEKIESVVVHTLTGSVEDHRDCMSKGVYLLAIHVSDKTRFIYEGDEVAFKTGHAIKFNDYHPHGVYVPPNARCILVSVDT
jgi:hypothetical protein